MTILTPDFYSYRWLPLTRADRAVDGALIESEDSTVLRLPRVSAGRRRFSTPRHLCGCYLDHDDGPSSARVWFRAAAGPLRADAPGAATDRKPEPPAEEVEP